MWYSEILNFLLAKPDLVNAVAAIGSAALAGVAVILSLISLYVSHAALKHQREHNRLSFLPLVYIVAGDYENQIFVKLRNNGTGPMIIKSIHIVGARDATKPLVVEMPELHPKVSWTNFVEDCTGRSVPAGGDLVLVDLSSESSLSQGQFTLSRDKVRLALGKLEIRVEYTDIYGTKLPTANRNFAFFHRRLTPEQLAPKT